MQTHFKTFKLLARTASQLCPVNMISVDQTELVPLANHVIEILEQVVPQACGSETQEVGPSQRYVIACVRSPARHVFTHARARLPYSAEANARSS